MRSIKAFVAAATIVLSYPLALGAQQLFDGGAETVIHFVTGAGFVLFATSVFDFELPRWVNVIGAVAAAAFGAIFLMQGVVDLTNIEPLRVLAFDVLGHHVERLLPDVVYLWFAALLLLDSAGRSRDPRMGRDAARRGRRGRHAGRPGLPVLLPEPEGADAAALRVAALRERRASRHSPSRP